MSVIKIISLYNYFPAVNTFTTANKWTLNKEETRETLFNHVNHVLYSLSESTLFGTLKHSNQIIAEVGRA